MSKTSEQIREIHKNKTGVSKFAADSTIISQVFATIVFPLFEVYINKTFTLPFLVLSFIYLVHLIFAIYSFFGVNKIKEFVNASHIDEIEQVLHKAKDDLDHAVLEKNQFNDYVITLAKQSVASQAGLSVLQSILEKAEVSPSESDVEAILAPLIQGRSEVLKFNNSEKYNFAVYIYKDEDSVLNLFYRECDNRIQRNDRSWKIGVGHVGICFAQQRTIISPDISKSDEFFGFDEMTEKDRSVYISFISTPIFISKNNINRTLGVLAITSDKPQHFSQEYKIIAETFALLLGIYFSRYTNHSSEN